MSALASTTDFIDLLRQCGIHQAGTLDEILARLPDLPDDPARAAGVLVQHNVLTRFQARLLLNGKSKGFRLGPYVVQDQLGQGGMGTVFLAEHAALRRRVALKVLTPPRDADGVQVAVERFMREARAAAALDHPNIVRIHDVAQQGAVYYLTLEYVDGDTLEQLLKKGGPITPSRAVGYIAQAAAGLQHADERGFVHRDIKPANLILTKDQRALKILDMGLARSFANEDDNLTERLEHGAVAGTVDFIAPEQALGATEIDVRADIYSLGATFFALLTGSPPFSGNTTQKLAQHQMKPAPDLTEIDPTLPPELAAVVARMLAKKPKDRYQTPAEVIAALAPWLGASRTNIPGGAASPNTGRHTGNVARESADQAAQNTLSEGSSGTSRRTTRRKKKAKAARDRKKTALIAGGALVLALAGIVGGALAFGGKKSEPVAQAPGGNPPAPSSNAPSNGPPKGPPAPVPTAPRTPKPVPKAAGEPTGPLVYHVDFADLQPATRSVPTGQKVFAQQIGDQSLPHGWAVNHHDLNAAADYFVGDAAGERALGMRHVQGSRVELHARLETVFARLAVGESRTFRVVYQFEGTGVAQVGVKRDTEPYTRHVMENLPPTNGEWRQAEFTFTRTDSAPAVFICNLSPDTKVAPAAGTVWLRSVDVWPARVGGAAAPASADRYAGWKVGSEVYKLDASAVAPFRVTKEGGKLTTGAAESLPKGVHAQCWRPDAIAEFRCESVDGSRVLGVTNYTDQKSGQFTVEVERELNAALTPGKVYRVTVGYSTRNDATGGLAVQTPDAKGYKNVLQIPLAATDAAWQTASGEFERRDGAPVRLNLENFAVGEGNIVYVRSIEVTELVKPD